MVHLPKRFETLNSITHQVGWNNFRVSKASLGKIQTQQHISKSFCLSHWKCTLPKNRRSIQSSDAQGCASPPPRHLPPSSSNGLRFHSQQREVICVSLYVMLCKTLKIPERKGATMCNFTLNNPITMSLSAMSRHSKYPTREINVALLNWYI